MSSHPFASVIEADNRVQLLALRVGRLQLAVPLLQVAAVHHQIGNKHPAADPHQAIVEFQGQPVNYYHLCPLLGQTSAYQALLELQDTLHTREQEHVDWLNALELALTRHTDFNKPRDPHQCAFGQWFDHFQTDNLQLQAVLSDFDLPHRTIHGLADTLLQQRDQGHVSEAVAALQQARHTTLAQLQNTFSRARQMLQAKIRPLSIFVRQNNGTIIGLEADAVADIVLVKYDDFTAPPLSTQVNNPIAGYVRLPEYGLLEVLNLAYFTA